MKKLLKVKPWNKLSTDNWYELLIRKPAFEKYFIWKDWTQFTIEQWKKFMDFQPEIAERHFPWHELEKDSWDLLLKDHSHLCDLCPHKDLQEKYANVEPANQAATLFRKIQASEVMKKYANVEIF